MASRTDDDIKAAITRVLGGIEHDEENVVVIRKDRHDRQSAILAIKFACDSLTFETVSQLAGEFMTPNMSIEPFAAYHDESTEYTTALLKVALRAPGHESQLVVEGEIEELPIVERDPSEAGALAGYCDPTP
jgi:hypothetical protein